MRLELAVSIAALLAVAGCASSGVIQSGQDTYMLSKTSAGCGLASAASVKADLFQEAGAFCSKTGRELEILASTGKDGIVMVRCASAEVQFACLAKVPENSPEYAERRRRLEARIAQEAATRPNETLVVSTPPVVMPAPAAAPRPTNCVSNRVGNTVVTNCY